MVIIRWLLLGLALRLFLTPFSLRTDPRFTGDIVGMNQYAHLLVFDPTSPLRGAPLYPLLAYFTMAFFQMLFRSLSPVVPLDVFGSQVLIEWATNYYKERDFHEPYLKSI